MKHIFKATPYSVKSKYRCPCCGKVLERDSDKAWIKGYCEQARKITHMIKVGNELK